MQLEVLLNFLKFHLDTLNKIYWVDKLEEVIKTFQENHEAIGI